MNFISPLSIISNSVLIFCYIFFSPTIKSLDLGHDLQKSVKMLKCAIGIEEEGRCIVDGGWSLWSVWGNCQGECGQVGRRVRQRTCNNPVPENGANCVGERQQFKQCSLPACNLEEYNKLLLNDTIRYSELKVLLMFNNTYPAIVTKCLAMNCAFDMVFNILTDSSLKFWNALLCVKLSTGCPVLGGWSPWGEWSRCNSRCGPGKRMHCRACKSPVPSSSEFDCRGENCTYETCMGTDCYIGPPQGGIWSEWSTWSGCSTTCGPGIQRRNRFCNARTKFREHTIPPITWTKAKEKLPLNNRLYNDDYYFDDDLIDNENYDDNVAELVSHKKKHTQHLKNHHKAILEEKEHKHRKTAGKGHKSKNKTKSKSKKKIRLKTGAKGELNSGIINDNLNTFKETVIDEEIASIDNRSTEFLANYSDTNLTDNSLNGINTEQLTESVNLIKDVTHDTKSTTETIPIVTDREILESTTVDTEIPSKSDNFRITRFNLKDILTAPSKLLKVHSECAQEDILGTTCVCSDNSRYDMNTGFKLFSDEMATLPIMTKNPTVEPVIQEGITNIPPITMEDLANTKENLPITTENSINTAESLPFTIEVTTENLPITTENSLSTAESLPFTKEVTTENLPITTENSPITTESVKITILNSPITSITESTPFPTINLPIETECVTMTTINSPITSITEKTPYPTENTPITSITEKTPYPTENTPITSITEKTPYPTENSPITSTTEKTPCPTENSPITSTTENTPCPTENSPITTIYLPSAMGNPTITTVNSSITTENLTLTTENVTSTKIGLFQKLFTFPSFHKDSTTVSSTTLNSVSSNTILTTPESNPPPICNTPVVWSMPECRTTLPPITRTPRPIECMEDSVTLEPFNLPQYNTNFVLQDCTGPFEEIKPCQNKPCDVDGEWSAWSAWSDCSAECGIGSRVKSRSCSNPPPRGNGTVCLGSITLKDHCFMKPCPEVTENVAFFEEKNQLAFPKNEIPAHLLHMYIRFRPYKPTGYLIVRQENICENKCVTTELVLHAGYLVFRADVLDCTVTLVSRNILSVGDWHDALITIVGEVVSLRIDDNLLQLTETLSCTPLYPDYDLPMIVGAGLLGEIDKVVINFVPVALNKKCDYTIPVNVQLPGRFPEDDTSVVFKPTEDEEAAHQSLEEFIQAPCFSNHLKWKVEIAVKPIENDGMIMLIPGDGDSDYLIVTLEQNRIRLRVKIGSDSAESVDNIDIVTTSWILLEIDKRENESISIAVNGNLRHGVAFPEGNEEDQFTIRCLGGILFGEVPASIKARVLTDALHYLPTHSVRGLLGLVAIDNEVQDLKNLPSKIPPASLEFQPSDSYLFSSRTSSKTAMYEQVEIISGETISLTCLYNISNQDSEVNVYSKDRKTSDVVATWVKLDLTVEKAFENISGVTYSVFDNGRITRLTIKSYTSGDDIAGFYSCWVQSPTTNITGLNLITYGVSVIDPNLHFNSWQMGLLRYLGYLAVLHAALMIVWLIFECFVDLKKGSGYYRCRKLSLESEKNAVLKLINSKKGMKLLGSEFMVDAARQRYLAQTLMDEEQRAINQDEEQRIKTAGQSVADLQKEHLNPTTTDEESDVPQKLVDIKQNHMVYQTRISQPTLTQVYRKTNDQIGPIKRENLNEKESRTNNGSKYNAKKKNVVFNKGYEPVNNDCDSEEEYLSKKQSMPCYLADINDEQDVGQPFLTKQNTIQENVLEDQKVRLRNRFPTNLMNKEENDFLKQVIYADLPTKVKYKQLNTTEDPSIGKITETPAYRKIESKMGKIIHKQSKIKNKDLFDVSY